MQTQNNRRPLRLALAGMVVLLAAVLVVRVFTGTGAPTARNFRAVNTTPAWLQARNRTAAEIAALEKRLNELNLAYADVLKTTFLLRQQLQASRQDALAREVEAARRAVEDALDHHPAIVALHQQLDQSNRNSYKLSDQQSVILTQLHARRTQRHEASGKAGFDIWTQLSAARQAYLKSIGKKDAAHLTPEEATALGELQDKYVQMAHDVVKADASWKPDDAEKQLTSDYQALGDLRSASDSHYTEVFNDIPVVRARLRAEDPTIAALDRALIEKHARLLAADNASPELAPLLRQLQAVGRQRAEVVAQLMKLRRPSAG
jgi:hypothetical protein